MSATESWNWDLISQYMIGAEPFEDPECLKCVFLPVCHGGCPSLRLQKGVHGRGNDHCAAMKTRPEEYLEMIYERCRKPAG